MGRFTRRQLSLAAGLCLGGASLGARSAYALPEGGDVSFDAVAAEAQALSRAPFVAPDTHLPAPFSALNYDGYRKLRPMPEHAISACSSSQLAVLPLPRGFLFRTPIDVKIGSAANGWTQANSNDYVDFVDYPDASADARAALGVSGWRLLRRETVGFSERAVFQGGSYFRAVADDLRYGASARGLALYTAGSQAEEFPFFRAFWIGASTDDATSVKALALLDSPSIAGVYEFTLTPAGAITTTAVRSALFPRTDLDEVGIAAMSSMFARGASDSGLRDARGNVHDSDGLMIDTGEERIWRPLTNPPIAQVSAFASDKLVGFGLLQRERRAAAYNDSEALYETRPSLWIRPGEDWGPGHVMLAELSTGNEYDDNIAAFWRPQDAWRAGRRYDLSYQVDWCAKPPSRAGFAPIADTRATHTRRGTQFRVDFATNAATRANVWAGSGRIEHQHIQNLDDQTQRLSFFLAAPHPVTELRAALTDENGRQITETWLFRWTRG